MLLMDDIAIRSKHFINLGCSGSWAMLEPFSREAQ
jgi:hypothetical protein